MQLVSKCVWNILIISMWYFFQSSYLSCYRDQTFALCAEQRGLVRCKNGLKIKIVSANYGRTDDQVCLGGKTDTLTCRSKSSEIKVKRICNGYTTCHLHATDRYFGDPCQSISKYLEVSYRCVKSIENDEKGSFFLFMVPI